MRYLFALLLIATPARADLDYLDSGQWTFNQDAAVQSGIVATTLNYGLQTWDATHPGDARFLDDYYFGGNRGYAVAWSGNVIAATTLTGGLYLIDASDTADLTLHDYSTGLGSNPDIAISGSYLYSAGDATNDFQVRNISSPASPSVVGNEQCAVALNAIALAGTHALCTAASRFYSINITTPASPALADSLEFGGTSVAYSSGTVAVGRGSSGFTLVDASNLAALSEQATVTPDAGEWTDLSVSDVILSVTGDTLYAITESGGCLIYGVSNLAAPSLLAYDPALDVVAGDPPYGNFNDGVLSGGIVYSAHWSGGRAGVVEFSATTTDSLGRTIGYDYCRDVAADHGMIYGCTGSYGVVAHEHVAPDSIVTRGRLPLLEVWGAEAHGPIVYICSTDAGLVTSEWNDPDSPTICDALDIGQARGVVVADTVAYVAAYSQGINTVSVRDIHNLAALDDTVRTGQQSVGVAVHDTICVTADRGDGMNVWSVADPNDIKWLANYDGGGDANDIALDATGAYAYLADNGNGIRIVDISTPASPSLVATFGNSATLSVSRDFNYLAAYRAGYAVGYDISDPEAPVALDSLDTTHGHATGHVFAKRVGAQFWVYAADYAGLTVGRLGIDVQDWSDYTFIETHPRLYLNAEKIQEIVDVHVTPNSDEWQGLVSSSDDGDAEGFWAGALRYAVGDYDEAEAAVLIDSIGSFIVNDPGIVFYGSRKYGAFTAHTSTNDSNPTTGPPGVGDWTDFGPLAASDSTFYNWGGQWWAPGVSYPVHHHIVGSFNSLARLGNDWACIYDWLYNATAMTDSVRLLIRDYVGTVQAASGATDYFGYWNQYPITSSSGNPYFNGSAKSLGGFPVWGLASYPDSSGTVSGITEPGYLQDWSDYVSSGFDYRWEWIRPLFGYAGPGGDPVAAWKGGFPAEGRDYGAGTALRYAQWMSACSTAFSDFDPAVEAPYFENYPQAWLYDFFYSTSQYRKWNGSAAVPTDWEYQHHPFGDAALKGDANFPGEAIAVWAALDFFPDAPYGPYARWCLENWPNASGYPENDPSLYGVWSVLWVRPDAPQTQPTDLPLQYFSPFQGLWWARSDWPANGDSPDIYTTYRCGNLLWFNQNAKDQGGWDLQAYGDWLFVRAGLYDGQGGFPVWAYHQATAGAQSIRVYREGDIMAWHPTEANDSHNGIWTWNGDTVQVNSGGQKYPYTGTFLDAWKDGIAGLDTIPGCRQEYVHDHGDTPRKEGNSVYVYALGDFTNAYDNDRWEDEYLGTELTTAGYTPRVNNVEREWVYLREDTLIAMYDRVTAAQDTFPKYFDAHTIYDPILADEYPAAWCTPPAKGDFGSNKVGPGDYESIAFDVTGEHGGQARLIWVADYDFTVEKVGSNEDHSGQWYYLNGTDWNPWPTWPSSQSGAHNDVGGHWRLTLNPTAAAKTNNLFTLVVPRPDTHTLAAVVTGATAPDSVATFQVGSLALTFSYDGTDLMDLTYTLGSAAVEHYVFDMKTSATFEIDGSTWADTLMSSPAGVLHFTSDPVTAITITEH